MSSTDDAIAAARASIERSRATPATKNSAMSDTLVAGAAIGAVVSLPLTGVGLVGGAIVGASIAAIDKLTKD